MKIKVQEIYDSPVPSFEIEETPLERAQFMSLLLHDADGQEDLYLGEIAKAEAGETILDLYNHYIHLYLFPDMAVLEDIWDPEPIDKQDTEGPGRCIRMSLAQTRQLLLDWLAAKEQWREERRARQAGASAGSPTTPVS